MSSRSAPVRWSEVTALFGGTFDPPHLGHRAAVQGLFARPGVERVRVLVSPSPPHKPTRASTEDRIVLTRLAFGASPGFPLAGPVEVDLREVERAHLAPGTPTYTFDTLSEIRREIPRVAFVIGTDQLQKLPTWHRFPEVLGLAHWIVLERKGAAPRSGSGSAPRDGLAPADEAAVGEALGQLEASSVLRREGSDWRVNVPGAPGASGAAGASGMGGSPTYLTVVTTPAQAVSSTEIRETLARHGEPAPGSLLPEVQAYLMQRRLYGTKHP